MAAKQSPLSPQALVRRHGAAVLRAAIAGSNSRSEADDLVQKTFLQLVRKRPQFNSDEHAKAWLLRVVINLCKDLNRSMWQREVGSLDELQEKRNSLSEVATPSTVVASGGSAESSKHCPESTLLASEQQSVLRQALAQLPAKQRICIHLFYYENLKIHEIATTTEMMPSTVKSHLHRGRAALQTILGEEYDYEA
jgi:RNA polymerase sigma-70 factor (ECF subfamily)